MSEIAIQVENLSKLYHIGRLQQRNDTLREALVNAFRRKRAGSSKGMIGEDEIWALKDVSFEVKRGEVLGVIGRNGAGKSTLLKILSQITEPTTGKAIINGKVSSLLEVGIGFHPELTGRENIYLNGAIIGMSRKEINLKFAEIVDFSEIEKFLDTPVKRYSSGMYVRLAFAVAAHMEPDILIIDEVLAVGDISFQKKCLGKMELLSKTGRTVLFVSHNLQAIGDLCTDAILLENGSIVIHEKPRNVITRYLSNNRTKEKLSEGLQRQTANFSIDRVSCYGASKEDRIKPHDELTIELDITPLTLSKDLSVHFIIVNDDNIRSLGFDSVDFGVIVEPEGLQRYRFMLKIPDCPLPPGSYRLELYIKNYAKNIIDHCEHIADFIVEQAPVYGNRLYEPQWHGVTLTTAFITANLVSQGNSDLSLNKLDINHENQSQK